MADEKNIPNPLDRKVLKQLRKRKTIDEKKKLNQPFIIDEKDFY